MTADNALPAGQAKASNLATLIGTAGGDNDGATSVQTYKSNAGGSTVTVRCWYTTVY